MNSSLVTRNVRIGERRTSVRLEPELWEALEGIADLEKCDLHQICTQVAQKRRPVGGFTSALRVYIVKYWRDATSRHMPRPLTREPGRELGRRVSA